MPWKVVEGMTELDEQRGWELSHIQDVVSIWQQQWWPLLPWPLQLLRVTVSTFSVTPSLTDQSSWFPRDKKRLYVEVPDPVWQPRSLLHVIFWHVYTGCSLWPPSGHWQSLGVPDGRVLGWRWPSHRHWVEAVTQHRQAPEFWHWSSPGMHQGSNLKR